MRIKFLFKFTAVAAAFLLLTGCAKVEEDIPIETTVTVTEEVKLPYPVTIGSLVFNDTPESAASLSPAITEIICELGFGSYLTGKSDYCNFPENIDGMAQLGSAANPDVEAIIENSPRLLISQSPIAKKDITAIEAADTRVLIITAPSSVDELQSLYSSIYRVFKGETDEETEIVEKCFSKLEAVLKSNSDILGSYIYLLSPDLAVASDKTFAGDFFSHFGKNCAGETEGNTITAEEIVEADPEWLILPPYMTAEDLSEELAGVSAVQNGQVIILDEEISALLERPTSRIYLAGEFIRKKADSVSDGENEEADSE